MIKCKNLHNFCSSWDNTLVLSKLSIRVQYTEESVNFVDMFSPWDNINGGIPDRT